MPTAVPKRREKPVILHFAYLTGDPCVGVSVAVPQHLTAQAEFAEVGFVNLTNVPVAGIRQFPYKKPFKIDRLPQPFCRPDLVVFQETYRVDYLRIAAQLRKRGIPYITVPHGELSASAQKQKHLKKAVANATIFYPFIHGAAAIQCLSVFEYDEVRFQVPKFIATNGIQMPREPKTSFREKTLKIVFIGRLDIQVKGLDLLIDAVGRCAEVLRKNGAKVYIYGPDRGESATLLPQMIAQNGVEDLVMRGDAVTGEEKAAVLLDADLFLQTSRHEGTPMGVLEALGYGLPCILTHGTTLAERLADVGAGFAAKNDADSVAEALKTAVREAECGKLSEYSAHARAFVEENFSWKTVAQNTVNLYRKIGDGCFD